jgi:predicted  nucleic acid-binding Zn-ribbon protein
MLLGLGFGLGAAAGVGVGALGMVGTHKITKSVVTRRLTNIRAKADELAALNVWYRDTYGPLVDMDPGTAEFHLEMTGFHTDGTNAYIHPFFTGVYNAWNDRSVAGFFTGKAAEAGRAFRADMQPIIAYFSRHGRVTVDPDTGRISFSSAAQMPKSDALMLFYANNLTLKYLELAQEIKSIPTTREALEAKVDVIKKMVSDIQTFKKAAFVKILAMPNTKIAGFFKQTLLGFFGLALPTARQKTIKAQIGAIDAYEEAQSKVAETAAAAAAGAEDNTPMTAAEQQALSAMLDAGEQERTTQVADALIADIIDKYMRATASAMVQRAHAADDYTVQGFVRACSEAQSKETTDVIGADVQSMRDGKKFSKGVLASKMVIGNSENAGIQQNTFGGFSKGQIIAWPTHHQAKYGRPGDLAVGIKLTKLVKGRSAAHVDQATATENAHLWAHIVTLTSVHTKITEAYQYEVDHGNGANSPLAYYLLVQMDAILSQMKRMYASLLHTPLLQQLIVRSECYYKKDGGILKAAGSKVRVGESGDMTPKQVAIQGMFADAQVSLAGVDWMLDQVSRMAKSALSRDLRQALVRIKQAHELVALTKEQAMVDASLQSDMMVLPPEDPRAVALDLAASLQAQPAGEGITALPIKVATAQWSTDVRKWTPVTDDEAFASVVSIRATHQRKAAVYQALLTSAHGYVRALNDALSGRKDASTIFQKINKVLKKQPYFSIMRARRRDQLVFQDNALVGDYDFHAVHALLSRMNAAVEDYGVTTQNTASDRYTEIVEQITNYTPAQMRKLKAEHEEAYEESFAAVEQRVTALSNKVTALSEDLAALEVANEELEDQLAEERASAVRVRDERLNTVAEIAAIREKLVTAEAELETTIAKHQAFSVKMAPQAAALTATRKQCQTLLAKVDAQARAHFTALEEQVTAWAEQAEVLKTLESSQLTELQASATVRMKAIEADEQNFIARKTAELQHELTASNLEEVTEAICDEASALFQTTKAVLQDEVKQRQVAIHTSFAKQIDGCTARAKQLAASIVSFKDAHADLATEGEALLSRLSKQQAEIAGLRASVEEVREGLQIVRTDLSQTKEALLAKIQEMYAQLQLELEAIRKKPSLAFDIDGVDVEGHMGAADDAKIEKRNAVDTYLVKAHSALAVLKLDGRSMADHVTNAQQQEAFAALLRVSAVAAVHRQRGPVTLGLPKSFLHIASQLNATHSAAFVEFLKKHVSALAVEYSNKKGTWPRVIGWFTRQSTVKLTRAKSKGGLTDHQLARVLKECVKMQHYLTHGVNYTVARDDTGAVQWRALAADLYSAPTGHAHTGTVAEGVDDCTTPRRAHATNRPRLASKPIDIQPSATTTATRSASSVASDGSGQGTPKGVADPGASIGALLSRSGTFGPKSVHGRDTVQVSQKEPGAIHAGQQQQASQLVSGH